MEEQCRLVILRNSRKFPLAVYSVEIDGVAVGKLKANSELTVNVSYGRHRMVFRQWGSIRKEIWFSIDNGATGAKIFVDIDTLSGKLYLNLQNAAIDPCADGGTSAMSKVKRGCCGCLTAFVVFLILVVVGSCLLSDDGKDKPTDSTQAETAEKGPAVSMLNSATKKFENGSYSAALELCDKIVSEYPESEQAVNMTAYKNEQLNRYIHISADDLMAEYEANVVNADEKYANKVMVISGTVSSISKNGGGYNLVVLLKSRTLLSCVQLNFNKDNTEAVSALREGSPITTIGNCTGKSGKVLVFISGLNVMIEDCIMLN